MEIIKIKIINILNNNLIPDKNLLTSYLSTLQIIYPIKPLIDILSPIQIKYNNCNEFYNYITIFYNTYKLALKELGYIEDTPDDIIILYLMLFINKFIFKIEEIDFFINKYDEIKDFVPKNQYQKQILYQIKFNILHLYSLKEEYFSYILPLNQEMKELYKTLDKPFIF